MQKNSKQYKKCYDNLLENGYSCFILDMVV